MNTCRCKLKCTAIENYEHSSKRYTFDAVYDSGIEEDRRFAKASPSGKFEIYIDNPSAQAFFEIGKSYYFDATQCES